MTLKKKQPGIVRRVWGLALRGLLLAALLMSGMDGRVGETARPTGAGPVSAPAGLMFIENVGQFPQGVRFYAPGTDSAFWLTDPAPGSGPAALWVAFVQRDRPALTPAERAGDMSPAALRLGRDNVEDASPTGAGAAGYGAAVRITFPDAAPDPQPTPLRRLDTRVSYFYGDDPMQWRPDVPAWAGVRYVDLYDGVDLEITGAGGQWAWRLTPSLAPSSWQGEGWGGGGNPGGLRYDTATPGAGGEIRLRIEGADAIELLAAPADGSGAGGIRLTTALGDFLLPLPTLTAATEENDALRQPQSDRGHDRVARIDTQTFDVIVPLAAGHQQYPESPISGPQAVGANANALAYATYLGGFSGDRGAGLAVDAAGNAYVTGNTSSPDFPTTPGVFGRFYHGGASDVFVAKLNSAGSALVYATFIGGLRDDLADDTGSSVAVDSEGNAYVAGWTNSPRFPATPDAYDVTHNGSLDSFVLKLNATGTALLYSTFLGGRQHDEVYDVAVDGDGNAYVTGWTASSDFPVVTEPPYDAYHGGLRDIFVTKLDNVGGALSYSMLVGGSNTDVGYAIAVHQGRAYVTGYTGSSNFPQVAPLWSFTPGPPARKGDWDAFLLMADPTGESLLWATYLGGSKTETGYDIAVKANGEVFVAGATDSNDFPVTAGAADTSFNGSVDAFVARARWLTSHSYLRYATYLGTSGAEYGYAIAIDSVDNAYVTGAIGDDAVTRLDTNGGSAAVLLDLPGNIFTSFTGSAIATDRAGGVYLLGDGPSLPVTPDAFDTTGNENDAWLAKIVAPNFVRGRVTDAHGQPLAGIVISAGGAWQATTDASGSYTLTVPAGVFAFWPTSAGYFWQPAGRSVAVPPDAAGQDFRGGHIRKQATAGVGPVAYGVVVTYTLTILSPPYGAALLYDVIPTHTTYVEASLKKPWNSTIAYDAAANAITGTLSYGTVSFAARVAVTGTVSAAPIIVNRACLRPPGSAETACEWSEQVRHFTYVWPLYLPVIRR